MRQDISGPSKDKLAGDLAQLESETKKESAHHFTVARENSLVSPYLLSPAQAPSPCLNNSAPSISQWAFHRSC